MYQNIHIVSDRENNTAEIYLWDDKKGLIRAPYRPYAYRKKRGGEYKSMYGEELERITKFGYGQAGLYESDVPAVTRVLIDAYGESDDISTGHRVGVIDIECKTDGGFPVVEEAQQPITAIALYDFVGDAYYVFVLDEENIVQERHDGNTHVLPYRNEEALLTAFLHKWEECGFTIMTGWNIDGFDMPYLYNRLKRVFNDKTAKRLSSIGIAYWQKNKNRMCIAGVSCLDYIELYKRFSQKKLPNFRLDTVGQLEVGMAKIHYDGSLNDLLKTDILKFIEYNLMDVKIVVALEKKFQFVDLARAICHVGHVAYEDYNVSSRFLEGALLTYLRRHDLVAPNKPEGGREEMDRKEEEDEEGFEGAYVKPPIPGLYEWVFSCDVNSLYPSIIRTLNISPETKVGLKVNNFDADKFASDDIEKLEFTDDSTAAWELGNMSLAEFKSFLKERNYCISSAGVVYDQTKDGILKSILTKWYAERVEFKNKMVEAKKAGDKATESFYRLRQQVQKILLNSLYGVLGLPIFRFYDLDNAESVTLTGQSIIKTTERFVNQVYNGMMETDGVDYVIYVDTDSNYITALPLAKKMGINVEDFNAIKKFTVSTATMFANNINAFYAVMMPNMFLAKDNQIKIAEDVIASTAIWVAKKRYAMNTVFDMEDGKDVDNKLKVLGIDTVRSSFPKKFGEFLTKFLKMILKKTPKIEMDKYVLEFKNHVNELQPNEIAKNTSVKFTGKQGDEIVNLDPKGRGLFQFLKGSTAQTKAALAYNDFLIKIGKQKHVEPIFHGAKIKYVYLKANPLGIDALAIKDDGTDPKEIVEFIKTYIDPDEIFRAELQKKLEDFYEALKWEIFNENAAKAEEFFSF
jgi:DNA polymerase elongation subunit (family B)